MTAHSRLALIFFSNSPNRLSSSAFHSRVAAITFSSSSSSSVGLKVSLPDHSSPAESTQMGKKKKGKQKRDIDTNPIVSDASILETRVTNLHISDNPNSSANTYVASTSTPNSPHHAVSSRASSSSSQTFGANPMGIWRPKGLATSAGATPVAGYSDTLSELRTDHKHEKKRGETTSPERLVAGFSSIAATKAPKVRHPIGVDFNVDSTTYSRAKVRATFYPKFENEKSDQEVRNRMIEMVGNGQATLEVTLKHSGSLFMYAGAEGGAYAKNSYGNIYTAVGVFVLGRIFLEAWGTEATKKQKEFNEFLEKNRTCISMELVTAVLGDHGQRPLEDYVVVTAVTELGNGKPRFYSTPDIIAFCRRWQLPTNHVWLFSSRKSAASFFAAFDALCEEGTATPVCKALDEVADISVPASKDHIEVQGEILEGLVARIVSQKSVEHLKNILSEYPAPQLEGAGLKMGSSLREVCRTNRNDEKQQIRALLQNVGTAMCPNHSDWFGNEEVGIGSRSADRSVLSKFLQAHPADYDTLKLQEIIRLMRLRRFQAAFKCYYNFNKFPSKDNIYLKMVIHVHNDSVFHRYHKEMRQNTGLWPLYRAKYWQKVADERRKKPETIILADKNAPNEEVWRLIENMSKSTRATAVPVIPDSEGTVSNPFSLDALAVFIYRVLHRVNHPGNLDGSSPNAGYVLLMFYNLYEGKDRREFESELSERFGNFIKMPLLRSDRDPLPDSIRIILEEGLDLYKLHNSKHGKLESTKGTYAKNWVEWERRLRGVLAENSDYITSIQVPFDYAVKTVLDKLNAILKGEVTPSTEKRKFGNIVYAAVTLPAEDIKAALEQFGNSNPKVKKLLERTNLHKTLQKAHVTLAHKRSHGVIAVASYGVFLNENAPVELTALLFSQNLAAFEVRLGTVDGQEISPKNEWPHLTLWYGEGASAKDANMLPKLHLEGQATRIELEKPVTVTGVVEFY